MNPELWRQVDSIEGVEPSFKVVCPVCFIRQYLNGTLDDFRPPLMYLRFSALTKLDGVGKGARACNMYYKCFDCCHTLPFGPPISEEHYEKILKLRGGQNYMPIQEWKEDEEKKKQLKGLGYI